MDATSIVSIATPIIVPLIIAGFKKIKPSIPSWILPMMAPVLGALLIIISNYALKANTSLLLAASLGLAGVGVREIIDQLKPEPEPAPKTIVPNP